MRLKILVVLLLLLLVSAHAAQDQALPAGFVRLRDVAPDIIQDMRYHGSHNFLGRPVDGYQSDECILTAPAAQALKEVSEELKASGYGVKVYDCYRPARAVADFVQWSRDTADQVTKAEFYPEVDKKDFFKLGYVAEKSGHSRGSTVDLSLVPLPAPKGQPYTPGQKLTACFAPQGQRFDDGSIDMGTGFDCMDERSHSLSKAVPDAAQKNRSILREAMVKHGFTPYQYEWWHFTLKNEPFPDKYFDFPVAKSQ